MNHRVNIVGSTYIHAQAVTWCWNNVGTQGTRWRWNSIRSYYNDSDQYAFYFLTEEDATMFSLRWS